MLIMKPKYFCCGGAANRSGCACLVVNQAPAALKSPKVANNFSKLGPPDIPITNDCYLRVVLIGRSVGQCALEVKLFSLRHRLIQM